MTALDHPRVGRFTIAFARFALGAAFLSGIMSRFGWWGKGRGYGDFAHFMQYTAQVNAFMPSWTIPYLAWAATALELGFGVLLVLGVRIREAALGSALLLTAFGLAMAASMGVESPLDYSVFSAVAAALFLAEHAPRATPIATHNDPEDS